MNNLRELLRDADPLRHEPVWPASQRDFCRQAVLAVASGAHAPAGAAPRSRIAVFATAALMVLGASLLGALVWSLFISDVQAAIRFEVRLAENRPAPGLHKAMVSGSDQLVYLHDEDIVTNGDIAAARVVQGNGPSQYSVSVEFNATGTQKMRAATQDHLGKILAILLDGQVVMAPVLRSPIGASAMITGNLTKSQAERIVKGIGIQ